LTIELQINELITKKCLINYFLSRDKSRFTKLKCVINY